MVALILIVIYAICFGYGYVLTHQKLHGKRSKESALSNQPNMNTYDERKPLIYANMLGVILITALFFTACEFMFSLSTHFSWGMLIFQTVFIMVLDDVWFYMYHRTLHVNKYLFRNIHSIHHRVRSTMPLDYIYAHPLEWILGTFGVFIACLILYYMFGSVNAYAMFIYGFLRTIHEMHIHSGLKSWLVEHRLLSWMGSSEHHTTHHTKFKGNYASAFKWWDMVFRTHLHPDTPVHPTKK